MATLLGKDGYVSVGDFDTSADERIHEIRGFSVEHTAETIDDTVMGETSRGYKVTYKGFTATVDVLYDVTSQGQTDLAVGTEVEINFFPESQGTYGTPDATDQRITGQAIVTGKTVTAAYDGIIEASVSLQGVGDLSITTV